MIRVKLKVRLKGACNVLWMIVITTLILADFVRISSSSSNLMRDEFPYDKLSPEVISVFPKYAENFQRPENEKITESDSDFATFTSDGSEIDGRLDDIADHLSSFEHHEPQEKGKVNGTTVMLFNIFTPEEVSFLAELVGEDAMRKLQDVPINNDNNNNQTLSQDHVKLESSNFQSEKLDIAKQRNQRMKNLLSRLSKKYKRRVETTTEHRSLENETEVSLRVTDMINRLQHQEQKNDLNNNNNDKLNNNDDYDDDDNYNENEDQTTSASSTEKSLESLLGEKLKKFSSGIHRVDIEDLLDLDDVKIQKHQLENPKPPPISSKTVPKRHTMHPKLRYQRPETRIVHRPSMNLKSHITPIEEEVYPDKVAYKNRPIIERYSASSSTSPPVVKTLDVSKLSRIPPAFDPHPLTKELSSGRGKPPPYVSDQHPATKELLLQQGNPSHVQDPFPETKELPPYHSPNPRPYIRIENPLPPPPPPPRRYIPPILSTSHREERKEVSTTPESIFYPQIPENFDPTMRPQTSYQSNPPKYVLSDSYRTSTITTNNFRVHTQTPKPKSLFDSTNDKNGPYKRPSLNFESSYQSPVSTITVTPKNAPNYQNSGPSSLYELPNDGSIHLKNSNIPSAGYEIKTSNAFPHHENIPIYQNLESSSLPEVPIFFPSNKHKNTADYELTTAKPPPLSLPSNLYGVPSTTMKPPNLQYIPAITTTVSPIIQSPVTKGYEMLKKINRLYDSLHENSKIETSTTTSTPSTKRATTKSTYITQIPIKLESLVSHRPGQGKVIIKGDKEHPPDTQFVSNKQVHETKSHHHQFKHQQLTDHSAGHLELIKAYENLFSLLGLPIHPYYGGLNPSLTNRNDDGEIEQLVQKTLASRENGDNEGSPKFLEDNAEFVSLFPENHANSKRGITKVSSLPQRFDHSKVGRKLPNFTENFDETGYQSLDKETEPKAQSHGLPPQSHLSPPKIESHPHALFALPKPDFIPHVVETEYIPVPDSLSSYLPPPKHMPKLHYPSTFHDQDVIKVKDEKYFKVPHNPKPTTYDIKVHSTDQKDRHKVSIVPLKSNESSQEISVTPHSINIEINIPTRDEFNVHHHNDYPHEFRYPKKNYRPQSGGHSLLNTPVLEDHYESGEKEEFPAHLKVKDVLSENYQSYELPDKKFNPPKYLEEGYHHPKQMEYSKEDYKSPNKDPHTDYNLPYIEDPQSDFKTDYKDQKEYQEGYNLPSKEYHPPTHSEGYTPPDKEYLPPEYETGYKPPNKDYHPPPPTTPDEAHNQYEIGYKIPSKDYQPPAHESGYVLPSKDYNPPKYQSGYKPPNKDYLPPHYDKGYKLPNKEYFPPDYGKGLKLPIKDYLPPHYKSGYEPPKHEYHPPPYEMGYKAPNENYSPPHYELGYEPPNTDYITPDYETGYKPPNKKYLAPSFEISYKVPDRDYLLPSHEKGYKLPNQDYLPPPHKNGYELPKQDYVLPSHKEGYALPHQDYKPPGYKQSYTNEEIQSPSYSSMGYEPPNKSYSHSNYDEHLEDELKLFQDYEHGYELPSQYISPSEDYKAINSEESSNLPEFADPPTEDGEFPKKRMKNRMPQYTDPPPRPILNSQMEPPEGSEEKYIPPKEDYELPKNYISPEELKEKKEKEEIKEKEVEEEGLAPFFGLVKMLNQTSQRLTLQEFKNDEEEEKEDLEEEEEEEKDEEAESFDKEIDESPGLPPIPTLPPQPKTFLPLLESLKPSLMKEIKNGLESGKTKTSSKKKIPGKPGVDYPDFTTIPITDFSCQNFILEGFYADTFTSCQVFHVCESGKRQSSFLCPKGTIFNQKHRVCDWWYNVKCEDSTEFYDLNLDLLLLDDAATDITSSSIDKLDIPPAIDPLSFDSIDDFLALMTKDDNNIENSKLLEEIRLLSNRRSSSESPLTNVIGSLRNRKSSQRRGNGGGGGDSGLCDLFGICDGGNEMHQSYEMDLPFVAQGSSVSEVTVESPDFSKRFLNVTSLENEEKEEERNSKTIVEELKEEEKEEKEEKEKDSPEKSKDINQGFALSERNTDNNAWKPVMKESALLTIDYPKNFSDRTLFKAEDNGWTPLSVIQF